MPALFKIVADALLGLSRHTGLTYNEINIILYYLVIPMTWAALLDKAFRFHWIKLGFLCGAAIVVGVAVIVFGFSAASDRLFDASAEFLGSFSPVGMNYVQASVVVCVVVPIIIYVVLIWLAFFKNNAGTTRTLG